MLKIILVQYTHYNLWANNSLLDLINSNFDETGLDREIISSFPSIRKTVYHIWDAEFIWLRRLKGESLDAWPNKNFNGTFKDATQRLLSTGEEFIRHIENLTEENIVKPFSYKNVEGRSFTNPVWESVHHCMNHSTFHRGQLVTMFRQSRIKNIPSTDFITYCRNVGIPSQ